MLRLTVSTEEYLMIGDDIKIAFLGGTKNHLRIMIDAQDGISAVQTAEGALNEVQDMLQRMNELAVKAANGTMSESDRNYIQDEIKQLETEIDRVAETTKFNETYLLKGVLSLLG